jgi:hypothetical protein
MNRLDLPTLGKATLFALAGAAASTVAIATTAANLGSLWGLLCAWPGFVAAAAMVSGWLGLRETLRQGRRA